MSVLVYAEQTVGEFKKATLELLSYGYSLAQKITTELVVVTTGTATETQLTDLGKYGASEVISITNRELTTAGAQAYARAIAQVADKVTANYILFQNNSNGSAIAPRLSVRLKAGLVSGVAELPNSYAPCVVNKKVFSGKGTAAVQVNTDKTILCLNPNSVAAIENSVACELTDFIADLPENVLSLRVTEVNRTQGKVPVAEAARLVSGGRGMQSAENWNVLEELARALSASLSCSKPVSDSEWRPHEEHIGQTGKTVSPSLYVAVGISGAIQHIAGVNSSKVIVAINNDPDAPIFKAADYGIIGDALEVVPELTKAIDALT